MARTITCSKCAKEKTHCAKGLCGACYKQASRDKDPEREAAAHQRYVDRHREEIKRRRREWYAEHKEERRPRKAAVCVECQQEKKISARGLCDACYKRRERRLRPELSRASKRRYNERHPDRVAARLRKRRERNRGYVSSRKILCLGCGHDMPHFGKGFCKTCHHRNWVQNNHGHVLMYAREWWHAHKKLKGPRVVLTPEERLSRNRKASLAWYYRNLEKGVTYRRNHKRAIRAAQRRWARMHPDHMALKASRRRDRIRGLPNTLTVHQWLAIQAAYKFRCAYCGRKKKLTMDHVTPSSKNGGTVCDNIVPACLSCNSAKGSRTPKIIPAVRLMI